MNEAKLKSLYKLYLSSLEPVNSRAQNWEAPEISHWEQPSEFSFKPDSLDSAMALAGSIRLLEVEEEHLICYLALTIDIDGRIAAYKLSQFGEFSCEYDVLIRSGGTSYLVELDNGFTLSKEEAAGSNFLGTVSPEQIEEVLHKLHKPLSADDKQSTDLTKVKNKFRIKEHELTAELRDRDWQKELWIPQLSLQLYRKPEAVLTKAAAGSGKEQIFGLMTQDDNTDVYYAANYTLHKDSCCDLLLIPDAAIVNRKGEIYCGELKVFKGVLPVKLILAHFLPLNPKQAQSFLQLKLNVLPEAY